MSAGWLLTWLYAKVKEIRAHNAFKNGDMQATSLGDTRKYVGAVKEKWEEDASKSIWKGHAL